MMVVVMADSNIDGLTGLHIVNHNNLFALFFFLLMRWYTSDRAMEPNSKHRTLHTCEWILHLELTFESFSKPCKLQTCIWILHRELTLAPSYG